MRLVYGVGINDKTRICSINGIHINEYTIWRSMLCRCYKKYYQEKHPTYIGCSVSDNFKNYSYFYDWCQNQVGFSESWDLDKDLLIKDNKTYSEDTCVFLPKEINCSIREHKYRDSGLPNGVNINPWSKRYISSIRINKKHTHIGTYDDPISAFNAYKEKKESYVKFLAEKYKDNIDSRAYEALIRYKINTNY